MVEATPEDQTHLLRAESDLRTAAASLIRDPVLCEADGRHDLTRRAAGFGPNGRQRGKITHTSAAMLRGGVIELFIRVARHGADLSRPRCLSPGPLDNGGGGGKRPG